MSGKHSTKNPVEPANPTEPANPVEPDLPPTEPMQMPERWDSDPALEGDLGDIVSDLDEPDDAADELSGEAELTPSTLYPEELAGDDDYSAVDEPVAEDPRDL